ncbi:alpha/beta fold hydrolase [Acuticoccus yangtzensis]|uniref:alpha/beta fold hydrolase n=1 Tax=Acuticoccus yangtzensis TaxID=1443441 RepID=UPI0009F97835|nr:alpha/beta hydrolase [Acuticoccus yangtzensis]
MTAAVRLTTAPAPTSAAKRTVTTTSVTTTTVTARDGTTLSARVYGPKGDPVPVVCLPGLSRNCRDFGCLAEALSSARGGRPRRVYALDLRGRGASGWADPSTYNVLQELEDVVACLDAWGIERAQLVGTSRGGLITMLMAMAAPERIERAVLNDIGPIIERRGLARIAGGIGAVMDHASFEALADYLTEAWGPQFPHLTHEKWLRAAHQLAAENDAGGVTLSFDPALAGTVRGYTADQPAPDFWPGFEALADKPVMIVRGAHSDLLSAATVEAMRRRHRDLTALVIPDEGHAPLLWDRFSIEAIRDFLS